MSMGGDLNGVLVETMITHVDCSDDKCSGVLIPLSFFFSYPGVFKVMNMFYSVVCCNLMRGDGHHQKKAHEELKSTSVLVFVSAAY